MSPTLATVVERARADSHFLQLLHSDPQTALAEYDLSQIERIALIRRDRSALQQLGVPEEFAEQYGISA